MLQIEMPYPVITLEGKELLPAGSPVTEQLAAELANLGKMHGHEMISLFDHGSVLSDLKRFLDIPPYNQIFADSYLVEHVLTHMKSVYLPWPLLIVLDHFRRHDFHTYRHNLMVFALSAMLGHELEPDGFHNKHVYLAGPTHDMGKVCIPLDILKKTSPLSRHERQVLNYHPVSGYLLLCYYFADHQHPAALFALNHHERRNGSGYPRGVDDISGFEEMIAACDVYDTLLSPRPYRPLSYDNRTALEVLTGMAEAGELSWFSVGALIAWNRRGQPNPDRVIVSRDKRGVPPAGNCYGQIADEK